ncbi:MAG: bifunctional D-glycero-beta-D-manno-heptose-7-phosphate kinase/D-glycero-beta-D-manno-heptose 1-phosphate adenylyltransferase HldE, partial [Methylococcaceae bacterium]|nr:bifunctional D-glycero-beta-D-manno-heptose-7-phosphate kinase/D-glycero-beta-D-manno-heptose 1-phosphate adenylyltransferase HldE [Methylococcaceae bacterium]
MKFQIPAFDRARVLVIGDIMLDRYWLGPVSRISPEAPVPVVRIDHEEHRPGGAANVALNVASLGGAAILLGFTGEDSAAAILTERLESAGVRCAFTRLSGVPTVIKLRVMSRNQQLMRLDFEQPFAAELGAGLVQAAREWFEKTHVVVLSDYGKGSLSASQALIEAARVAGRPVLVDPKSRDFSSYRGATLVSPNLSEFEAIVGPCADEFALVERGMNLLREHRLEALLVTRGEHGMTLLRDGLSQLHLPAQAREVYDVTGAGDTVLATLAASLAAGSELPDAVALANRAAGIVVGKLGTATVSALELGQTMLQGDGPERGIMSEDQLLNAVAAARERGERIVMTNGCFDILHAGHVVYLEKARTLGDRLIVAVNDDDSVARLKGAGRPINPLDRRMAVLAGLA